MPFTSWSLLCSRFPSVRKKVSKRGGFHPIGGMDAKPVEHIGHVSVGIDLVQLAGHDDGVEDGGGSSGALGTGEKVVVSSNRNGPKASFGEIIARRDPGIGKESVQASRMVPSR